MNSINRIWFIGKILIWSIPIFFLSQLFHESGHLWAGILAGYEINHLSVTFYGSYVNLNVTNPSTLLYKMVLLAGGLTATILLGIVYIYVDGFGPEFSITLFTFIQVEAVTAIMESMMNYFYLTHFFYLTLLAVPALLISLKLNQN